MDERDEPGSDDDLGIRWHSDDSAWNDISGFGETSGPEPDLTAKPFVFRLAMISSSESARPGETHSQQHPVDFEQFLIVRTGRVEFANGSGVAVANAGEVVRFPAGARYRWTALTDASVIEFSLRRARP